MICSGCDLCSPRSWSLNLSFKSVFHKVYAIAQIDFSSHKLKRLQLIPDEKNMEITIALWAWNRKFSNKYILKNKYNSAECDRSYPSQNQSWMVFPKHWNLNGKKFQPESWKTYQKLSYDYMTKISTWLVNLDNNFSLPGWNFAKLLFHHVNKWVKLLEDLRNEQKMHILDFLLWPIIETCN